MIAVDTSALAAIVFEEPRAQFCLAALEDETLCVASSVTLAEALIVASRRGKAGKMADLIDAIALSVAPVTEQTARRVAAAYARWGKGVHPARLNFADCFAYDLASTRGCPLLYVGQDFAQTDVASALADPA